MKETVPCVDVTLYCNTFQPIDCEFCGAETRNYINIAGSEITEKIDFMDGHQMNILDPETCDYSKGWYDATAMLIEEESHAEFQRVGKKAAGRMLDGRTWDEYPS